MFAIVETDRHKFSNKAMHVLLHGEDAEGGSVAKVATIDGCIVTIDYYTALAKGLISGHTSFYSLGYNPNILSTTEDICEWSTTYVVPAAGGIQMRVISTSASDAAAGVGVRTVELHYLDANYAEQLETVTLNGVTPVNTVATNILRVNYFHTVTAGSTAQAVGDVTLENTGGTVKYAQISAGGNFSRHGFFTIPAGKTGYISGGYLSCGGTTSGRFVRANLRTTSEIGRAHV